MTGEWPHHSCFLWRRLSGQTITDGQAFLSSMAVLQNYFVLGGDPSLQAYTPAYVAYSCRSWLL